MKPPTYIIALRQPILLRRELLTCTAVVTSIWPKKCGESIKRRDVQKAFAGLWKDDRTDKEIIDDIRAARNANIKEK
jgi:hypothetical protein